MKAKTMKPQATIEMRRLELAAVRELIPAQLYEMVDYLAFALDLAMYRIEELETAAKAVREAPPKRRRLK